MRLRLSAHNGRELEFLTETAAENRRFISLDIDFYISNLATTGGREIISGERMINRYIYSGAWLLEIIFEIRSSIFFSFSIVNLEEKEEGNRSIIHSPVLHPELIPRQVLTIWKSNITSLLRSWLRN